MLLNREECVSDRVGHWHWTEGISLYHGHSGSRYSDLLDFIVYHFSSRMGHKTMWEIKAMREGKEICTQILIILQRLDQLLLNP